MRAPGAAVALGFPVFTYGTYPAGPIRLDPRDPDGLISARVGNLLVGREDFVFADDDGALFVAAEDIGRVTETAHTIWQTERKQAEEVKAGRTLRSQFRFGEYLAKRAVDPSYTFRQHLRALGKAIEE